MDEDPRFGYLKYLSKVHRHALDERRSYEWKVVTAVVTLPVIAVGAKYAGKLPFVSSGNSSLVVIVLAAILITISCFALHEIHQRNKINKDFAQAAENEIVKLVNEVNLDTALEQMKDSAICSPYWSYVWECLFIFVFTVACAFMICI